MASLTISLPDHLENIQNKVTMVTLLTDLADWPKDRLTVIFFYILKGMVFVTLFVCECKDSQYNILKASNSLDSF